MMAGHAHTTLTATTTTWASAWMETSKQASTHVSLLSLSAPFSKRVKTVQYNTKEVSPNTTSVIGRSTCSLLSLLPAPRVYPSLICIDSSSPDSFKLDCTQDTFYISPFSPNCTDFRTPINAKEALKPTMSPGRLQSLHQKQQATARCSHRTPHSFDRRTRRPQLGKPYLLLCRCALRSEDKIPLLPSMLTALERVGDTSSACGVSRSLRGPSRLLRPTLDP